MKNYINESTLVGVLDGNIDNINEDDIKKLKSRIKEVEKKIKENNKPKTITIGGKEHAIIKKYCNTFGLNIGEWVSKVLLKEINSNDCVIKEDISYDEFLENGSKILKENFTKFESTKYSNLWKSNKIVINKDCKFVGYSITDGLPIYNIVNPNLEELNSLYSIELKKSSYKEVSCNIFHNMDLDISIF